MRVAVSSLGVLVLILVTGQAVALEEKEFEPVRKLCLERNNMTEHEYAVLMQEKDWEGAGTNFKCFGHCLAEKLGYLDDMGKYNVKKLEEDSKMNKDQLTKVMECIVKYDKEDDPCEYIFKISKCAMGVLQK